MYFFFFDELTKMQEENNKSMDNRYVGKYK